MKENETILNMFHSFTQITTVLFVGENIANFGWFLTELYNSMFKIL